MYVIASTKVHLHLLTVAVICFSQLTSIKCLPGLGKGTSRHFYGLLLTSEYSNLLTILLLGTLFTGHLIEDRCLIVGFQPLDKVDMLTDKTILFM